MVGNLVPLSSVGSVANRPSPNWQVCHTTYYIPLIVLAEPRGWKMLPIPPFRGTRNNHWLFPLWMEVHHVILTRKMDNFTLLLLMEEILLTTWDILGCTKPCKKWDTGVLNHQQYGILKGLCVSKQAFIPLVSLNTAGYSWSFPDSSSSLRSWEPKGTPPMPPPPGNKALLMDYQPPLSLRFPW